MTQSATNSPCFLKSWDGIKENGVHAVKGSLWGIVSVVSAVALGVIVIAAVTFVLGCISWDIHFLLNTFSYAPFKAIAYTCVYVALDVLAFAVFSTPTRSAFKFCRNMTNDGFNNMWSHYKSLRLHHTQPNRSPVPA